MRRTRRESQVSEKSDASLAAKPVKLVRDAHGCYCQQCKAVIADDCSPYWHWRKSQRLHEQGTGHKVIMFRYE